MSVSDIVFVVYQLHVDVGQLYCVCCLSVSR